MAFEKKSYKEDRMKDICKILMQGPCPRTVTTGCFEPAVKIPMGNSHGQFDVYAKICGKNGSPRLRPAFCANPRSRNAFGHVTSDVTREFGSKVAQTKTTAYTSCKPAPSNAHGYLTQAISRESKEKKRKTDPPAPYHPQCGHTVREKK